LLLAGCGSVDGDAGRDAATADLDGAASDSDADLGRRPDAAPGTACIVDGFDGALPNQWQVRAGVMPSYSIAASTLTIDDAATASAPSMPGMSWIYNLDTDLGNQFGRAHAIGDSDFFVYGSASFNTTDAELTLAGVGLTNAAHQLELLIGVSDGSATGLGIPFAAMRRQGDDLLWGGTEAPAGGGTFEIRRVANRVTIVLGGMEVLSDAMVAELTDVVIVAVRYSDGGGPRQFGSFAVDSLSVCY
jgi:hypothetical protein